MGLLLDGTDDRIATTALTNVPVTYPLSICAVVKRAASGAWHGIAQASRDQLANGWELEINNLNQIFWRAPSASGIAFTGTIPSGQWCFVGYSGSSATSHLAFAVNLETRAEIVNATSTATQTIVAPSQIALKLFSWENTAGGFGDFFNGEAAYLALYRAAFSVANFRDLVRDGPWSVMPPSNLFSFLEGAGTNAFDSVTGMRATLTNFPAAPWRPVPAPLQPWWVRAARPSIFLPNTGLSLVSRVNESLNLAEGSALASGLSRLAVEQVSIAEGLPLSRALTRQFADSESIAEASLRALALLRSQAETLQVNETALSVRVLRRLLTETINLTEASSYALGRSQVVNEAIALAESTARVLGKVLAISETLNLGETTARVLGKVVTVAEALSLAELTARARALVRPLAETLNQAEALTSTQALTRLIAESQAVLEATPTARALARVIAEATALVDAQVRSRSLVRVATESLSLAETLVRKLSQTSATFLFAALSVLTRLAGVVAVAPRVDGQVDSAPRLGGKIEVDE